MRNVMQFATGEFLVFGCFSLAVTYTRCRSHTYGKSTFALIKKFNGYM